MKFLGIDDLLASKSLSSRAFAEAVSEAYAALFEGLNPYQKTRRALRALLPEPPEGWDAPAVDDSGNQVVSRNGNVLSWIVTLETYIRDTFFHDRGIADKFEPGVARIAYTDMGLWPEGVKDYRGTPVNSREEMVPQIRSILRMFTGAHLDEVDNDLNGLSLDELVSRYGSTGAAADDTDDTEDTGHTDYRVVRVDSFDDASEFYDYWDGAEHSRWCIVADRQYWNRYTRRGKYTAYFLVSPDAENIPPEPGPGAPKDRYGLSLVGIMIGPEGGVEFCCVRWNHAYGGSDHELSEKELSRMLGRPVRTLCPYVGGASSRTLTAKKIIERLDAGETPEQIYDMSKFSETTVFDRRVLAYTLPDGGTVVVDPETRHPIWPIEFTNYYRLDDICMYGESRADETDAYGDDVYIQWLLRKDGQFALLGAGSPDFRNDALVDGVATDVTTTVIPGIYRVRCEYEPYSDTLVDSEFNRVCDMHDSVEIIGEDRIVVCDLGNDTWRDDTGGGDGCPEIISLAGEGQLLGYMLYDELGGTPQCLYSVYLDNGHLNVMFQLDDRIYMVTGGKRVIVATGVDYVDRMAGAAPVMDLVRLYRTDDDGDTVDILDLLTGKIMISGLKDCDDDGVVTRADGMMNMINETEGLLFDKWWDKVENAGGIYCAGPRNIVILSDKSGKKAFYDKARQAFAGDRMLPASARSPYTKGLYVRNLGDGMVICTYDGEVRSPKFTDFLEMNPFNGSVVRREGETERKYMVLDINTGKPITPWIDRIDEVVSTWPGAAKELAGKLDETGLKRTSHYSEVFKLTYGDRAAVGVCYGGAWKLAKFGWVKNSIRFVRDLPLVGIYIDDFKGPDGDGEVTYDLSLEKIVPWKRTEQLDMLEFLARSVQGDLYDDQNRYMHIEAAMKKVPDWIEYVEKNYTGGNNG